jgi:hypothetical protein
MSLAFDTGFSINCVVWITSIAEPDEVALVEEMTEQQQALCGMHKVPFISHKVSTVAQLLQSLDEVKAAVENGAKPLINFLIHGNADSGMYIADEGAFASWPLVVDKLRAINIAMKNNLCVLSHTCFAFHSIKEVRITDASPFFILIAPEQKVSFRFVYDNVFQFYEDLWNTGDITKSYDRNLKSSMKIFYSEKMLAVVLCRYIVKACRGKSGAQRRERLLTEVILGGMEPTKENLRAARRKMKAHLKPDQTLVDRYVSKFLIGKACPFSMDDLLKFIDAGDGAAATG